MFYTLTVESSFKSAEMEDSMIHTAQYSNFTDLFLSLERALNHQQFVIDCPNYEAMAEGILASVLYHPYETSPRLEIVRGKGLRIKVSYAKTNGEDTAITS